LTGLCRGTSPEGPLPVGLEKHPASDRSFCRHKVLAPVPLTKTLSSTMKSYSDEDLEQLAERVEALGGYL